MRNPKVSITVSYTHLLHYGSDAGAEMAATYRSVIGTAKLHGSSIWNFIGSFFKNIFNGCRDYVNTVSHTHLLSAKLKSVWICGICGERNNNKQNKN